MCYHLYENQKKAKKKSVLRLLTATFFLFLPKKLFLLFLQVSNSSSSRLGFLFFAPHNNSREWRESKGKKVFRFLWFVNSTLVCLIIARFKVKIYANFTRGKSRLLEGKERKKNFFLFQMQKGDAEFVAKTELKLRKIFACEFAKQDNHNLQHFWGILFFHSKFWHVLVYYVLKKVFKTHWLWDMWLKHNKKLFNNKFFSWKLSGSCHHII